MSQASNEPEHFKPPRGSAANLSTLSANQRRVDGLNQKPIAPTLAVKVSWIIVAILFTWLLVYPFIGGLVVANDDLKFLRGDLNHGSLWENIRISWLQTNSFRPLENIVATLCDEQTLSCWMVVPIQISALALVAAGVVAVTRRVLPGHAIAAPLIIIWILLSPCTMTALWQMDTCSQTWVAALAVWCGILAWDIFIAARAGKPILVKWLVLFVACALAMNIKETFFGWSASIGLACIIAALLEWRRNRHASRIGALTLIPIAVMPAIYLVLRYTLGGLATVQVQDNPEGRYQVGLGENIVNNLFMSTFGLFTNGPLHLFNNESAALPLRALPALSLLAAGAILLAAAGFRFLHKKSPIHISLATVLWVSLVCMTSIVVTLPMGSVSDLYGFGPNIGSGLLLVTACLMLWNPSDESDRSLARFIATSAVLLITSVGLYGVASRTYQFSMTWYYARRLNTIVMQHQASLPPFKLGDQVPYIYFTSNCYTGHIYGQIMIRPLQSLSIQWMSQWLNRADPKHPIQLVLVKQPTQRPGIDLIVDCADFPVRHDW